MATQILSVRRARIERVPGELRIVIPGWLTWPVVVFLVVWLYTALTLEARELLHAIHGEIDWQSIGWLIFWAFHVVAAFGFLLWLIAGREIVTVDGVWLTWRTEILGLGWSRRFPLAEVRNLVPFSQLDPASQGKWDLEFLHTSIVFNVGDKTYRFGRGLAYAEANRVIDAIHQAYPGYG